MTSTQAIGDLLDHIGFRKEPDESGAMTWELPVAPHVVNNSGGLQGGLVATLVDIAAGTLALDSLPVGGVVTSDLSVRYFRAVTTGTARAVSTIVHAGKRSIVVQVEVRNMPENHLAALATVSFAIVGYNTRTGN
ncbi:PaaI family thioesterase [Nocardia flavorosea]|uniref:PaaI family thioesterase n=1 Tax=Nocardia flavorosea TaxID=53429 RepID=A0A846YJ48_9NOCA|nr:PaaI family thioesterase [Nocardia flavorosea]NKY57841.1 PaaI family thioesterase [Nocardia flavorosea]